MGNATTLPCFGGASNNSGYGIFAEERVYALIADKQNLSEEIRSNGAESSLTKMSNEQLISMVSLDLNSALEG